MEMPTAQIEKLFEYFQLQEEELNPLLGDDLDSARNIDG